MNNNPQKGTATRKAGGWHPTLEYTNGGRLIGAISFWTEDQARFEAWQMIECMERNPTAFETNHPGENQIIDLSANTKAQATQPE